MPAGASPLEDRFPEQYKPDGGKLFRRDGTIPVMKDSGPLDPPCGRRCQIRKETGRQTVRSYAILVSRTSRERAPKLSVFQ